MSKDTVTAANGAPASGVLVLACAGTACSGAQAGSNGTYVIAGLASDVGRGVALCIDVEPWRVERRHEHRYLDEIAHSLEGRAGVLVLVVPDLGLDRYEGALREHGYHVARNELG